MDVSNPFVAILDEIKSLRIDVHKLSDRIPENVSIKRYSPQDIANNTPLTVQTVRAAIKDGRIEAERFGRKYLITQKEFDRVCVEAKSLKYKRV